MATISFTRSLVRSSVGVLILGAAITAATADAATSRGTYRSATAVCSGPLPEFDAGLRRSPIGIRNQGVTNVFISCSLEGDFVGDNLNGFVRPYFHNFGTTPATVNCTMVAGNRSSGFGAVAGTTGSFNAGTNSSIIYEDIDKVSQLGSYNFSCILPPEVEINNIILIEYDVSDGL